MDNTSKLFDTNPQEWAKQLQSFLYNKVLLLAEPDPKKRIKLVEQKPMETWILAFTHKSFNPNTGENYEVLEYLGDQAMASSLAKYLIRRFKGINQAQLSTFKSHYLDKVRLAQLSVELGLPKFVRARYSSISINEDLMESFIGGLVNIADEYIQEGLGSVYCFNFVVNVFGKVKVSPELFLGMPRTQVKEIFEKLNWMKKGSKPPDVSTQLQDKSYKVVVKLTPESINWFKNRGTNLTNLVGGNVIGTATGSKKAAITTAYDIALATLRTLGIDWNRANEIKNQADFQNPEISPYLASVRSKLQKLGLKGMSFPKTDIVKSRGQNVKYVQLIGFDSKNKQHILSMVKGRDGDDDITLRVKAITQFLAS